MMNGVCKTTNTASELFMAGKCQEWMCAGGVWEDCMLRRDKWERSPYVGREVAETEAGNEITGGEGAGRKAPKRVERLASPRW